MSTESLIKKLEALKCPDPFVSDRIDENMAIDACIDIIRQHEAQRPQDVVQRVAIALANHDHYAQAQLRRIFGEPIEDVGLYTAENWRDYTDEARAAIAAMGDAAIRKDAGSETAQFSNIPHQTQTLNLLPCPFCGGAAYYTPNLSVSCSNKACRISHNAMSDEAWNTRAPVSGSEIPVIDEAIEGKPYEAISDVLRDYFNKEDYFTDTAIKNIFDIFRPYLKQEAQPAEIPVVSGAAMNLLRYMEIWCSTGKGDLSLTQHMHRATKELREAFSSEPMRESGEEAIGTFSCPHCGKDTPHQHFIGKKGDVI